MKKDEYRKRQGLFDEDRSGFSFREVFTPLREGPLPPRPKRSGKGGPSLGVKKPGGTSSVWSASDAAANSATLSNGGLTFTPPGDAVWRSIRSSISRTSGKLYIEVLNSATVTGYMKIGLADATFSAASNYLGALNYSFGVDPPSGGAGIASSGFVLVGSIAVTPVNAGDVLSIAIDFAAQKIWLARNNTWASSGNPSTGASPYVTFTAATTGALFPAMSFYLGAGVWTLQSTAASQKYAPPSGFSAWDGGVTLTPAQAYLARTVGGNEGGNAANITTLIDGLVADGVWAKLDALYVLAQQNATDALLNLVGTSYGLTQQGSLARPGPRTGTLVFTSYRGFAGFNTLATYLSTGFTASVAPSPKFTQNSASFGVWSLGGIPAEAAAQMGTALLGEAGESHIYNDFTDGNFYPRINGSVGGVPSPGTVGFFAADRPSSATVVPYSNGAALASQSAASQAPNNRVFTIGAVASAAIMGSSQTLSAAFIGASLGATLQLALYNRLNTYMTAVTPVVASVWSATDATANGMTLSNGGLTVTNTVAGPKTIRNTISHTTGKFYIEFLCKAHPASYDEYWGVASSGFVPANYLGTSNYSVGLGYGANAFSTGFNVIYNAEGYAIVDAVIKLAVDFDAGKVFIGRDNTWSSGSDPSAGSLPISTFTPATVGALFAGLSLKTLGETWTLQPTAASQKYAPPAGFSAWG